jgi:hypothetical protein
VSYWSAKSDLKFMREFREAVGKKWELEDDYANWEHPTNHRYLGPRPEVTDDALYKEDRGRIAEQMNRAEAIARRHKVQHSMSVVLRDGGNAPSPDRQRMLDGVNRAVGAVEEEVRDERPHIWNPLWWLLHGPFMLLRSAGVNTDKAERHLWSRVAVQFTVDLAIAVLVALVLNALGVGG